MSDKEHRIFKLNQRVARLERQMAFLLKQLELECPGEADHGVSPEIIELLRKGKKLKAVQLFRQETGAGLKDAKEYLESIQD